MKKDWFYPTAFSVWGGEEKAAIRRVMASGRYTMGEEVEAFEHEFAAYHGRKHGIMTNSGSSANLLMAAVIACEQLTSKFRGVAFIPAIAWSTTYAPFVQYGFDIKLMDCSAQTWNVDKKPYRFFTSGQNYDVRVVVGCSILGNPACLDTLKFDSDVDAYFIEDNCESFDARLPNGHLCGTYGVMSSFSFFYSHQISAIEGGMVLTDDDIMAEACRMHRAHGWTRDVKDPATFEDEYNFKVFGYNVRSTEMHAAIAREQLKKQKNHKLMRQMNVSLFRELTKDLPIEHPVINGDANPFGLAFTMGSRDIRSCLVESLREHGIDCRLPTGGSFRLHGYGQSIGRTQETPNADFIHRCGLFLGNGALDLSDQITKAVSVMKDVLLRKAA